MCDLCGGTIGSHSYSPTRGRCLYICDVCDRLRVDNKVIFEWVAGIYVTLEQKIRRDLEKIGYELPIKVDDRLSLVQQTWIDKAREDNEKHIRSEVQKILFVDGMGERT